MASPDQLIRAFKGKVAQDELNVLQSQADVQNASLSLCSRFTISAEELSNEWEVSRSSVCVVPALSKSEGTVCMQRSLPLTSQH